MKKLLPLLLAALLLLTACASTSAPQATEAPVATEAPATEAPATDVPATDVPATEVPATEAPATEVPATDAPATEAPAAEALSLKELVRSVCTDTAELVTMPAMDLTDLLGIEAEDYAEQVWLQSEGLDGREIIALRAVDADAAGRIQSALENYLAQRRKETQNYLPEVYKLLNTVQVERKDTLVLLVVGEDAAREVSAIFAGV